MGILDIIKIPKLVEIVNQFKLGSVTINFGGKHYHVSTPPKTEVKKLEGIQVTQDWEIEFAKKLEQDIKNKEPQFISLPEDEKYREIAITSASSAATFLEDKLDESIFPSKDFDFSIGEGADNIISVPLSRGMKKPSTFD